MSEPPRDPAVELTKLGRTLHSEVTAGAGFHELTDELVGYLDDTLRDLDDPGMFEDPLYSEAFLDGYRYARYHVREFQLTYSKMVACECDDPRDRFPQQYESGTWICESCDAVVLDERATDADEDEAMADE